jgi:hypothetical protein
MGVLPTPRPHRGHICPHKLSQKTTGLPLRLILGSGWKSVSLFLASEQCTYFTLLSFVSIVLQKYSHYVACGLLGSGVKRNSPAVTGLPMSCVH